MLTCRRAAPATTASQPPGGRRPVAFGPAVCPMVRLSPAVYRSGKRAGAAKLLADLSACRSDRHDMQAPAAGGRPLTPAYDGCATTSERKTFTSDENGIGVRKKAAPGLWRFRRHHWSPSFTIAPSRGGGRFAVDSCSARYFTTWRPGPLDGDGHSSDVHMVLGAIASRLQGEIDRSRRAGTTERRGVVGTSDTCSIGGTGHPRRDAVRGIQTYVVWLRLRRTGTTWNAGTAEAAPRRRATCGRCWKRAAVGTFVATRRPNRPQRRRADVRSWGNMGAKDSGGTDSDRAAGSSNAS